MTTTVITKDWTGRNGTTRSYIQNVAEILGLDYATYKNGGVRSAALPNTTVSNAEASRILGIKAWLQDGKLYVSENRTRSFTDQEVISIISAALKGE